MVLRKNGPLYLRIGNNNKMISCWAVSETTPVRVSIMMSRICWLSKLHISIAFSSKYFNSVIRKIDIPIQYCESGFAAVISKKAKRAAELAEINQ